MRIRPLLWWAAGGIATSALAIVIALSVAFDAVSRSPVWLNRALDHFFPAAKVSIGKFEWLAGGGVELSDIAVRSRESGALLAMAKGVRARLDPAFITRGNIEEIFIDQPVVFAGPELLDLLQIGSPAADAPARPPAWKIGRLRCDFGELYLAGLPAFPFFVSSRFAFDLHDAGTAPEIADKVHRATIWAVSVSANPTYTDPFFSLDLVETHFSIAEILGSKLIGSVEIRGGNLRVAETLQRLRSLQAAPAPSPTTTTPDPDGQTSGRWEIGTLSLHDLRASPGAVAAPFPDMAFTVHSTLSRIPLSDIAAAVGAETQLVEIANVEIPSPLDPLVRVLSLHSVFVYFSLDSLLDRRIQRLVILNPTIYVSSDLFAYMEKMTPDPHLSPQPPTADADADADLESGWIVEQLRVEFGRLVLGGERIGQVGLPLSFHTEADDVRFDSLSSLRLRSRLEITPQDFAFPPLQLEIDKLGGDMRFAYPPSKQPDNLVNVLRADHLRWRQFDASDLWLSTTFERQGISARIGGRAYSGYINAGLSFYFDRDARWVGWVSASGIDLTKLTSVLAPQNLRITGPANLTVEVDAQASAISRIKGRLRSDSPGTLTITKIDDFLANLPPEWGSLKTSLAEAALAALRDFDYSSASADFWFTEGQGRLDLTMPGKRGSRTIELLLHADETAEGRWKNTTR